MELEKRGYSVLIKCLHAQEIYFTQNRICKPKYFAKVLGVFAGYDTYTLRICVQNCIAFDKIINLQWEQMISREQEEKDSFQTPKELAKEIVHLSWGERNVERLVNVAQIDRKKVIKCGNISLDMLKEEFGAYYLSRDAICEQYGFSKEKKICTLFASFGFTNYTEEELEIVRKRMGDEKVKMVENATIAQKEVLNWLKKAAAKYPEYIFIYRPHPGERLPTVLKEMEELLNFYVISDYSSKQWIFVSDFMFSWHSTVIVEAFLAGKTCYSLEPVSYIRSQDCVVFEGMRPIEDYDTVEKILSGEVIDNCLNAELVYQYFGDKDERYSFEKVADAFEKVYHEEFYSLKDIVSHYDLYTKVYKTIKERIWANPIINSIPIFVNSITSSLSTAIIFAN